MTGPVALKAAYIVTWVILLGYLGSLLRRFRRVGEESKDFKRRQGDEAPRNHRAHREIHFKTPENILETYSSHRHWNCSDFGCDFLRVLCASVVNTTFMVRG